MMIHLLFSVIVFAALLVVTNSQSAVYVRFLSPPHGYSHGLQVHYPGGVPIAREERLFIPNQQYQPQPQQYHYPKPMRSFHELGSQFQGYPRTRPVPVPEQLYPMGVFYGPSSASDFQRDHPGPTYDPYLATEEMARRAMAIIMAHGVLFFHNIPHERLVLRNNQERVQNFLQPHILGSIRPGHPFFNYNK
ncbi:hypothetical protein LSTR_LSTR007723 [Laodelphax striatellus]|uniref:Uncharacterized protein n=1 Tax=Laodelphax striatellus TaxID=195883 RepID=A0A482WXV0_LAOST|nr:hypothetical protein LSTR_LSTR007723 [Laodelphax striatellus]